MSASASNSTTPGVPSTMLAAERVARGATRGRLRVLAYHGVDDPERFEEQMWHVHHRYTPVSAEQVVAAFHGHAGLPADAVWVTFDDGLPSVIEHGLAALTRTGVPATLFICPGLVESHSPNWWDVVETAVAHGRPGAVAPEGSGALVTHLKSLPDAQRRARVDEMADDLARRDVAVPTRQLTPDEIDRWRAAGNQVGNHSWDHPCLDRCSPDEQRRQVTDAHEWLRAHVPDAAPVFAYPNGNATPAVEHALADLGYELALVFDHRIARVDQPRFQVSRLRVSSAASSTRFVAILSGAHSAGYHVKRRMTRSRDTSLRTSTVDDHNRDIYEQPEVVDAFAHRTELMPCESVLLDTYVAPGAAVLDVGVGAGRTTAALRETAGSYVGIDFSAPMIDAARARHPHARFEVMDAADLGAFDDASFDVVIFSFNGIDYLHPTEKRRRAIAELARVARPGGTVIVSSHNARALARPPIEREGGATRAAAVQIAMSARLAGRALTSRAFWAGEGYLRDTASPHTNYAATPERMVADFSTCGLELRETVGSRYPSTLAPWMEPWYYYAFRKGSTPG